MAPDTSMPERENPQGPAHQRGGSYLRDTPPPEKNQRTRYLHDANTDAQIACWYRKEIKTIQDLINE
jgi:hypothetical protein